MKKKLSCLLAGAAAVLLSCASAPKESPPVPVIESETAIPEPVIEIELDNAFDEDYDHYMTALIMDGAQYHTVVYRDTLSGIARRYYGSLTDIYDAGPYNGFYFPVILLASSDCGISDPDKIIPGMDLVIPDLKKNLADPGSRRAIKDFLHDIAFIYGMKGNRSSEEGLAKLSDSIPQ